MDNTSNNSSVKKMRENFYRQVRKSQIQKIHKQKREKLMKTNNPLFYLQKIKTEIINENLEIQKIIETINFISQNIKNQQFAQIIENDQLIEIIILKTVQAIQPWIKKGPSINHSNLYQYSSFERCQYSDCQQNSTSISQNCQGQFFNEEFNINNNNFMQRMNLNSPQIFLSNSENKNQKQNLLLSELLHLLNKIFQMVSFQDSNYFYKKPSQYKSYENKNFSTNFRFKKLFMQTPQILQGLVLDLLSFQKIIIFKENFLNQTQIIELRYPLIFNIVTLLSKYVQISCFDQDQWMFILKKYVIYSQKIYTEVKNECPNIREIKEILILLQKSYLSKDILSNTKFIDEVNKLIFPWLKCINQTFIEQNNRRDGRKINFTEDFTQEFQYALKILQDLKFLQKNVNQQIKLILGEILNMSKSLEKESNTSEVNYFHVSPKFYQKQGFQIQRKCTQYAQKLIEILYLQMELTQDDLNMITQIQPSMQAKIQRIIDADCY